MAESFTTDDWEFNLGGDKPERPRLKNEDALPWLADPKVWKQYQNDLIYEIDCLVRDWINACKKNKKWMRSPRMRRYTVGMVFEQIYGRKFDRSKDAKITWHMARVLSYYSSKIQKEASINGKQMKNKVYTISPTRVNKPPYSLRLRLEWLSEQGMVPTRDNMKLPKDDLKPGHARNPKTEANMARRRREAQDKYNERYNRHGADSR